MRNEATTASRLHHPAGLVPPSRAEMAGFGGVPPTPSTISDLRRNARSELYLVVAPLEKLNQALLAASVCSSSASQSTSPSARPGSLGSVVLAPLVSPHGISHLSAIDRFVESQTLGDGHTLRIRERDDSRIVSCGTGRTRTSIVSLSIFGLPWLLRRIQSSNYRLRPSRTRG